MRTALQERPVRGTSASTCRTSEANRNVKVQRIEGFNKYHNFRFQEDGVIVWKAYNTGHGKVIPFEQFCKVSQQATGLEVQEEFLDHSCSREWKGNKRSKDCQTSHTLFQCSEGNYSKTLISPVKY